MTQIKFSLKLIPVLIITNKMSIYNSFYFLMLYKLRLALQLELAAITSYDSLIIPALHTETQCIISRNFYLFPDQCITYWFKYVYLPFLWLIAGGKEDLSSSGNLLKYLKSVVQIEHILTTFAMCVVRHFFGFVRSGSVNYILLLHNCVHVSFSLKPQVCKYKLNF